jgi:hypothetical protein
MSNINLIQKKNKETKDEYLDNHEEDSVSDSANVYEEKIDTVVSAQSSNCDSIDSEEKCAICLCDFEDMKSKVVLECSHTFHYSCILQWNLQSRDGTNHHSCPVCRSDMGVQSIITPIRSEPIIRIPLQNFRPMNHGFFENNEIDIDDLEATIDTNVEGNANVGGITDANAEGNTDTNIGADTEAIVEGNTININNIYSNTTDFASATVRDISRYDEGLMICCRDCQQPLIQCESCSTRVCGCAYTDDNYNWANRQFHSPINPFADHNSISNYNIESDDEPPMIHCSRCFENRDGLVLDFMMDDHGDLDPYDHQIIRDYYELFYCNHSGQEYPILTMDYPDYTDRYDDFCEYIRIEVNNQRNSILDEFEY